MVSVRALLVPPLSHPRLPELPLGVWTVTDAAPGLETRLVGIATRSTWLLTTVVLSVVPLMITTEDETNSLPFTVRRKPCCTWASVMLVADNDVITGDGRELPHNGLSALHPGRNNNANAIAHSGHEAQRKGWLG